MRTLTPYSTGLLALALLTTPLAAQQRGFDRTKAPTPGKAPTLTVPTWTKTRLANGADLIVTQKHDLPLVAFSISFIGGRSNFEPTDKPGVASLTAQMLSEGTATKTGEQFSDAQQLLGTSIFANVGGETGAVSFTALKTKLEPAMALVADMLANPSFPADALERLRGRTIVGLTQARDRPEAIAGNVFQKVLYGDAHPYGRVVTQETVRAITRDDIVAFHRAYFRPGRAVISVTGDVDPAAVRAMVERALASWPAGGDRPTFAYPPPPALRATTIYLVDKPGAAQSIFHIGMPGPARDTPDYYAIRVMNTILGGLFQSRLNHDIREVKGWSYGVNSSFGFGRGPGAFDANGGIVTAKTDSALIAFLAHLRGVQGGQPFTADEIEQGKASLVQSLPRQFSSVNSTGSSVATIYTQGLPENYYQEYSARINAVTSADMVRVAKKYIDMDHLNIIIVGDRAVIEPMLVATKVAPLQLLDLDGKPVIKP
jgi:predicted Zn-dependent peptidase